MGGTQGRNYNLNRVVKLDFTELIFEHTGINKVQLSLLFWAM